MQLFRAIKKLSTTELNKSYTRRASIRLPSHVPYLIDNLWEYLRPEKMPCRRHAVYVSPTKELAIANAAKSASGEMPIAYFVCIEGSHRIAQLKVTDARHHQDILKIRDLVQKHHAEWALLSMAQRQRFAILFTPGCSKEDWTKVIQEELVAAAFSHEASAISEFWQDASNDVRCSDGELFFEMDDETVNYRLLAV